MTDFELVSLGDVAASRRGLQIVTFDANAHDDDPACDVVWTSLQCS